MGQHGEGGVARHHPSDVLQVVAHHLGSDPAPEELTRLGEPVAIGQAVQRTEDAVEGSCGEHPRDSCLVQVRLAELDSAQDPQIREENAAPLDLLGGTPARRTASASHIRPRT